MQQRLILLFSVLLVTGTCFGQRNVRDSIISTPWCAVTYGANWTGGDLVDRYGFTNHLGTMIGYKTSKNWVYSLDGNFHFGNKINFDDPFHELRDSKGNLTDQNGDIAIFYTYHRGMNVNASIGKVFPVLSPNKNSGIFTQFGTGFYAHKMHIESIDQFIPAIEQGYEKGYDKLTQGINFSQFLGYALMANRGVANFYGGFYCMQGLTKNRRTVFFDQPDTPVSQDLRLDLQFGFKLGWFIPIYKRLPKEFYYD